MWPLNTQGHQSDPRASGTHQGRRAATEARLSCRPFPPLLKSSVQAGQCPCSLPLTPGVQPPSVPHLSPCMALPQAHHHACFSHVSGAGCERSPLRSGRETEGCSRTPGWSLSATAQGTGRPRQAHGLPSCGGVTQACPNPSSCCSLLPGRFPAAQVRSEHPSSAEAESRTPALGGSGWLLLSR